MAKTSDVAASAAVPSNADIQRAAAFAREPFLLDGEGPEALAPGRDGAELNPHQLDALSGTLAELMAQQQEVTDDELRNGGPAEVEAEARPEAEEVDPVEAELDGTDEDDEEPEDEEPQDWQDAPPEDD